jgi:mono/diheme cytochrome c family protein
VPVEADGSAYFRAPARKPLYFQAVDEHGRAVQSMRSVTYLQPGERQGCVGCHEPRNRAVTTQKTRPLAMRREPSQLKAGPEGTRPFSFPFLVQPILDKNCVNCHDGNPGPNKSKVALTGEPAEQFTKSYENLKPFVKWYEWGGASIEPIVTRPGRIGAHVSPFTGILYHSLNGPSVKHDDDEKPRLYKRLAGNVPFYGTYDSDTQLAQQNGVSVPPPALQ